jgi:hypothetical protein
VQSTAAKLITVTGTDTITGTMSPVLTAYAAGQLFYFISNGTNTGAMTINIDGLGAKAITRDGSTALIAGDVVSGEIVVICYDGTRFQMINAANSFGNTTINGTLTVTGDTALQANVSVTSALTVNGTFGVTGAATLGSTLSVAGKSDLPTVSTASMNAAVAVVTTGTVTNLTSTSASIASMNAGVALLTTATVTTLTASGASIASANIGNLQFTAASIASINAGVALITTGTVTNLTSTSASIASANVGTAVITTGTLTNLTATSASVASANLGVALVTTGTVTNLTSTGASIASANLGNAVISSMTLTGASVASVNVGTATITGNLTLSGGTANGVLYLNGSKVATSGSALTFDGGANLSTGGSNASTYNTLNVNNTASNGFSRLLFNIGTSGANGTAAIKYAPGVFFAIGPDANDTTTPIVFNLNNATEQMRLTSTGLGIGTSSPACKLHIAGNSSANITPDILIARSSSGTTISSGPSITFADGTTNNTVNLQNTQGRFGVWNYGAGAWLERLSVDSSGNLGLGVTPSAWDTTVFRTFQLGTGAGSGALSGRTDGANNVALTVNAYYGTGAYRYVGTGTATLYNQQNGVHSWQTAASGTAGNAITFTQAMTLDASGRLQLGTTTAAGMLTVSAPASTTYGTFNAVSNGFGYLTLRNNGTDCGYIGPGALGSGNQLSLASAGSTPILFGTNGSERARITAAGEFVVGSTTSAYTSSGRGVIEVNGSSQSLYGFRTGGTARGYLLHDGTNLTISNDVSAAPLIFQTAASERARITSGGVLLVGATSNFGAADDRLQVDTATASARSGIFRNNTSATDTVGVWNSATTGDNLFIQFYTEAGASVRGNITYNRGAGQVAYNVTSDVRLKDNIADAVDAGSKVDALQVRQFDWKETGNHVDYGFVAQELDAIAPQAVSKPDDEEAMWSVDYSKLVPMLVKEIQSLRARVAQLESK